jgi:formamidopyrimidine-DNA glycosylase
MPELPEVETVVRSLAPHLTGRRIVSARFRSRFVTPGNRKKLAERLSGRRIESVRRRGKFILIALDQGALAIHLGMTGKLLMADPENLVSQDGGNENEHTHGIFVLDRGVLQYHDPRQFGRIEWGALRASKLGPEPLEIGLEEFTARLRQRKAHIKPLLLNQRFLAGLGNIYVDESLFLAGIHPLATASRISRARAAGLLQTIREVLTLAIEHRGSSISDYVDADGNRGDFQGMHRAYGREGEPCVQCGAPIRKITVVQRGTHFCPKCQKY